MMILFPLTFIFLFFSFSKIMEIFSVNKYGTRKGLNKKIFTRRDAQSIPVDRSAEEGLFDGKIFQMAYKHHGRLTLSEVVIGTGMGLKQAESYMDLLVKGAHVRMEINEQGLLLYEFPEIIDSSGGN